jgi:hypothetical protein
VSIDHKVRYERANLDDLIEILTALEAAKFALLQTMDGKGGRTAHERFAFKIGFARGRLSRISSRLYEAGENAQ